LKNISPKSINDEIFINLNLLKTNDMVNKVILVGNVGADPEVRRIDPNTTVANLRLATSESYTDKQGVKQTITEWHTIVAWRGLAEIIEKYVQKGSMLYIEGRIRTRTYDDPNGTKKYFTEILADSMKMLNRVNSNSSSEGGYPQSGSSSYTPPAANSYEAQAGEIESIGSDDLPF
jgi:single stranded DNA-binding protein (ssb)